MFFEEIIKGLTKKMLHGDVQPTHG